MRTEVSKIAELIKNYIVEYNTQEHPFLLFDIAHVNENDHTRILMSILRYNNGMFVDSFLHYIGATECKELKTRPTDQKKAIGNSGDGFIDLYFDYTSATGNTEKVILENKIYGASDTRRQLLRYIATALEMTKEEFENQIEKWEHGNIDQDTKNRLKSIHVLYLTLDGGKQPDVSSLPQNFLGDNNEGNYINFYPINYVKHIIPWIENEVLPNVPYSDDGITIAGVRQYIASLKSLTSDTEDSKIISDFINTLDIGDKDKYEEINNVLDIIKPLSVKGKKTNKKDSRELINCLEERGISIEDNIPIQPMQRNLKAAAEEIFSFDVKNLMDGEWVLHFTPSFFVLYKKLWADIDVNKLTIPSLYLCGNNFVENKNNKITRFGLQVDHIPTEVKNDFFDIVREKKADIKFSNHDLTVVFNLNSGIKEIKCDNVNSKEEREKVYTDLIKSLEKLLPSIDNIVFSILNNPKGKPHHQLLEGLLEKFD